MVVVRETTSALHRSSKFINLKQTFSVIWKTVWIRSPFVRWISDSGQLRVKTIIFSVFFLVILPTPQHKIIFVLRHYLFIFMSLQGICTVALLDYGSGLPCLTPWITGGTTWTENLYSCVVIYCRWCHPEIHSAFIVLFYFINNTKSSAITRQDRHFIFNSAVKLLWQILMADIERSYQTGIRLHCQPSTCPPVRRGCLFYSV